MKREGREDHRFGMSDPGNLAKKLEQRLFFKEYIKVDDRGHKKHIVDTGDEATRDMLR